MCKLSLERGILGLIPQELSTFPHHFSLCPVAHKVEHFAGQWTIVTHLSPLPQCWHYEHIPQYLAFQIWVIQLRSLCLQSQHFSDWTISAGSLYKCFTSSWGWHKESGAYWMSILRLYLKIRLIVKQENAIIIWGHCSRCWGCNESNVDRAKITTQHIGGKWYNIDLGVKGHKEGGVSSVSLCALKNVRNTNRYITILKNKSIICTFPVFMK